MIEGSHYPKTNELKWKYNKKTNNIKIIDSHKYTSKEFMKFKLRLMPLDKINRSEKSCLNEWIAHNRLYKLGLFKDRCKDTDLTMNESLFRRIIYWLLSRCYFK